MLDYLRFLTEHRPGAHRWVYIGIIVLLVLDLLHTADPFDPLSWALFGTLMLLPLIQAIRPTLLGWFILWFPWSLFSITMLVTWLPMDIPDTLSFMDTVFIYYTLMPVIILVAGYPRRSRIMVDDTVDHDMNRDGVIHAG